MDIIIAVILISFYAVFSFNLLTRKHDIYMLMVLKRENKTSKKKSFSKSHIVIAEFIMSFLVIFLVSRLHLTYFLPKTWSPRSYTYYTYFLLFVVASVMVLVATIFNFYFYFKKKDRDKEHYLIRIKSVNILPLTSVFYAAISFLVIIAGLSVIEITSDYSDWLKEQDSIEYLTSRKKGPSSDYPIVRLKGAEQEAKAEVKILVVGDSFIAGSGTSNLNYLWWKQLQNELDKRGYDCVVYGVGRGGASTYDELQWLAETSMVQDIKPDIIIIGYVANDAEFPDKSLNPKVWMNFSEITGFPITDILSSFFPSVFQTLKYKIIDKAANYNIFNNDRIGYHYKNWQLQLVGEEHLELFKQHVIKPLGDFVKSIDIPILLLTTPDIPDKAFYEPRYKPILPLYEEAGLKVYDSLDDFSEKYSDEKYKEGYYINPVNGHPGTFTNMFYAKFIADKLEADYAVVLGEANKNDSVFDVEITDWIPSALLPRKISANGTIATYTITYPSSELDEFGKKRFLFLPARKDYVKLNFKYPVDISSVQISGENLRSVTIYVTSINDSLGYDNQIMHELGKRDGGNCTWIDNSAVYVTSLCIHAKTLNRASTDLSVTVTCEKGAVRP